ncbi:P0560B06.18 [Oryza sativa Japonica Group]|uniref:p0560B06.18 protein n=1 Tax=Oryza sativa subsp. japonica TaxID=39947 RepID=Q93W60_ORYSJ|nr:P0560B06.18 [Oryza sativa Japonica Group]
MEKITTPEPPRWSSNWGRRFTSTGMDLVVMMKETHQRWIPVAVWSTSSSPSPSSSPPSPPLAEAHQSCLLLPDLAVPRPTTVNSDGRGEEGEARQHDDWLLSFGRRVLGGGGVVSVTEMGMEGGEKEK